MSEEWPDWKNWKPRDQLGYIHTRLDKVLGTVADDKARAELQEIADKLKGVAANT